MRTRTLGLILLAVSPALLLVRAPSSAGRMAEPDTGPVYRNPLDVDVDKEGKSARVTLAGTRAVAVVDLITGRFVEEKIPGVEEAPQEARKNRSLHFPEQTEKKNRGSRFNMM